MSFIYAGDLMADAAFKLLLTSISARLVDVRTKAETHFVGAPVLPVKNSLDQNLQSQYCQIEWQLFPTMLKNDSFIAELEQQLTLWHEQDGVDKQDRDLLFLCRSDVRSAHAAHVATLLGCNKSYNITHGFEGGANENGHRSQISGWKFMGLPWSQ